MIRCLLFCFSLVLGHVAGLGDLAPKIAIAYRGDQHSHPGWTRSQDKCVGNEPVRFAIFLVQQNLDRLLEVFHAVSNPKSQSYGQFLTKPEVDAIVKASPESIKAVTGWLAGHAVDTIQVRADSVVVDTTCATASVLFGVPFHHYIQRSTGRTQVLFHGAASIPAELKMHIDFVQGISELWQSSSPTVHRDQTSISSTGLGGADTDLKVTPKLLREYYGVPDAEVNPSSNNLQAVVAFNGYYSKEALQEFYKYTDGGLGAAPVLTEIGIDSRESGESDLDVQYMTAMAGSGSVQTLFHNTNSTQGWVLGFSENAQELTPFPKVFSLSYGWSELGQCGKYGPGHAVCAALGYDATKYVERTNVNFQKLGVMGASIFVSDGDDGAPSMFPDGWNPLDLANWCPSKGGFRPDGQTACGDRQTKCGNVVLRRQETGDQCVYPTGRVNGLLNGNGCSWLFDSVEDGQIIEALKTANPSCGLDFPTAGSLGSQLAKFEWMYSSCTCDQLQPININGVVSEQFVFNASKVLFYADFPTSSPYVTSVGATVFKSADGTTVNGEHAASIKDGAIITTGGGFSQLTDMPTWQQHAVKAYEAGSTPKPPTQSYDVTKRGYPDISLNGHNYMIYTSSRNGPLNVDGTSASTPALAGLVSLINGYLLAAGKNQLGFINPLLYAAYAEDQSIFKDVTVGDNKCTRANCMVYGYNAGEGWDPVSGLGTINYSKLKAYALSHGKPRRSELFV